MARMLPQEKATLTCELHKILHANSLLVAADGEENESFTDFLDKALDNYAHAMVDGPAWLEKQHKLGPSSYLRLKDGFPYSRQRFFVEALQHWEALSQHSEDARARDFFHHLTRSVLFPWSHEALLKRMYSAEQRIKEHLDVRFGALSVLALTVLTTPEHYQFRLREARRECEELCRQVGSVRVRLEGTVGQI